MEGRIYRTVTKYYFIVQYTMTTTD